MAVYSLEKGENQRIEKSSKIVKVGAGWDVGDNFDLDLAAFLLDANGKMTDQRDFVYFRNLKDGYGAVELSGDNRTGEGAGDDETITIKFDSIPAKIQKVVLVVAIFKGAERKQNFGQVKNAFVRLCDITNGTETPQMRYDLTEDYSAKTAIRVAEIYRFEDGWKMKALGEGIKGDFNTFISEYGD